MTIQIDRTGNFWSSLQMVFEGSFSISIACRDEALALVVPISQVADDSHWF